MAELYVDDLCKDFRSIDVFFIIQAILRESSVVVQLLMCWNRFLHCLSVYYLKPEWKWRDWYAKYWKKVRLRTDGSYLLSWVGYRRTRYGYPCGWWHLCSPFIINFIISKLFDHYVRLSSLFPLHIPLILLPCRSVNTPWPLITPALKKASMVSPFVKIIRPLPSLISSLKVPK